ncbi:PhnD/SsuA/transferrin family substrate-binding protein [Mesorhizobium sp. VNQ89]|uniref:PhnD/SsuA/transferrin family substrate-binding protein n=1 Tax=Mesorhizobium quangtriensis TaxID=3157709 RepID=UPI0032B732EC
MLKMIGAVAALAMMTLTATAADKVRFAVTDVEGLEKLHQEFGPFRDELQELTGLEIEFFPVNSRTAAVEALTSDQVDLVLTGPAEYVVMKELTNAEIVTAWQRPEYYAQVVVLADGPIKTVAALKGKKVAFGSVGSTSQHLGPAQVLTDLGLPQSDYTPEIISRNVAVEAMINGDIAAVGMNRGHLASIREAYPETAFIVLARGRDLPNDVLVARADADAAVVQKVRDAFVNNGKDLMASVVETTDDNKKYEGGFFITTVKDADYDYVRDMYRTIGVDSFNAFVGD